MSSVVKVGELVSFRTGKLNSNASKPNGTYPFFTCSQETYRTDTYSFETECVLLAGNNANGVYPIKYFSGRFDAYQRTYVIESLNQKTLLTRYLFYALKLQLEHLRSVSTGAATKFLTLPLLKGIEIRLPSLKAQERVVSILSAYDDLIENNTRRIAILEDMARGVYEEWFDRFRFPGFERAAMAECESGSVPAGWSIQGLYDVADLTYGFPFKSKLFDDSGSGLGVVRIRDIKSDRASTTTTESADAKYCIADGDILVGMDGEFHMGRWAGGVAWLNQRVVRFRPKSGIPRSWLFWATEGPIKRLEATIVGTTVAHLSARDLKEMHLLVPSRRVLELAASALDPLFDLELLLKKKNANLRTTRDLLLPKLISGELDVSTLPEPEALAA